MIPTKFNYQLHEIWYTLSSVADHHWFEPPLVRENLSKSPSQPRLATNEPLVEDCWASMITAAVVYETKSYFMCYKVYLKHTGFSYTFHCWRTTMLQFDFTEKLHWKTQDILVLKTFAIHHDTHVHQLYDNAPLLTF